MSRAAGKHKHFILDEAKIRRAKRLLGARSETEAIEPALNEVIAERKRNVAAWRAHLRFLKSGVKIRDVYRRLDGRD